MTNNEEVLNNIVNKLADLSESFREFREVGLEEKLSAMESRLLSHIDGFIKLHETLDQELVAMRSKVDRLETRLQRVETKLGFAAA